MTRGRSGGRSMRTVCRPPPLMNVPRAWSTSAATSEGSGATDSVPVSMRPASSRSPIRLSMRSACSSMMRKNCATSAGPTRRAARSAVAAEPLIEVSGARSSWLTMPRNSARMRSISCSGARSCRVTTTEASASVRAVRVADRGGVDERRDAAPVRDREHDLLGPHRLGAVQRPRQRQPVERDLAPVGAPAGDRPRAVARRTGRGRHRSCDDACGPRG